MADPWDALSAISDHLPRASEGVVLCLAEACASHTGARNVQVDASMGSVLECAACLDIAAIKGMVAADRALRFKIELRDIFRMLVGLKRSWDATGVHEGPIPYGSDERPETQGQVFFHDKLDVYQAALDIVRWAHGCDAIRQLPRRQLRGFDALLTSIVLNLAEGNGRFSRDDHRRFVETSHCAAIKVATHLDLWLQQKMLPLGKVKEAHDLLVRVVSMTGALVERLHG